MFKKPVYVLDVQAGKFRLAGTRPFNFCVVCRTGTKDCFVWRRGSPTTEADAHAQAHDLCRGLAGAAYSVNYKLSLVMGVPEFYEHVLAESIVLAEPVVLAESVRLAELVLEPEQKV